MAARQMEEIQKKLAMLNYPRANALLNPSFLQEMSAMLFSNGSSSGGSFLYRLLGDKSPFSQQNLNGDAMDRDEEAARIQYLAEIAKFLDMTALSSYR